MKLSFPRKKNIEIPGSDEILNGIYRLTIDALATKYYVLFLLILVYEEIPASLGLVSLIAIFKEEVKLK